MPRVLGHTYIGAARTYLRKGKSRAFFADLARTSTSTDHDRGLYTYTAGEVLLARGAAFSDTAFVRKE